MADTVTSQSIVDEAQQAVLKFTDTSDGTGEAAVKKVDVSALNVATEVKINGIWYYTKGMGVDILWDATTDVLAFSIAADSFGYLDFRGFGGLVNNSGSGKTGDINFTTVGASNGDVYLIVLDVEKV